jgi:hypothetical protein
VKKIRSERNDAVLEKEREQHDLTVGERVLLRIVQTRRSPDYTQQMIRQRAQRSQTEAANNQAEAQYGNGRPL